jgi:hypothetical protein
MSRLPPVAVTFALVIAIGPLSLASSRSGTPSKASAKTGLMPEGFVGRERSVMAALFPHWTPGTERTGSDAPEAPEHARLREARRWAAGSRTLLAVLVDVWSGSLCDSHATCEPQPTDLAVFESRAGALLLIGHEPGVAHHGGGSDATLDSQSRRFSRDNPLIGVRETTRLPDHIVSTLRLYLTDEDSLRRVFERSIGDTTPPAKGRKAAGCTATVAADEFGTPPYPLKISEHCTQTGKTSTELWRWNGTQYLLHGPASDAAVADDDFTKVTDEPSE